MACLSEESWASLPKMLSERASLRQERLPDEDLKPNFLRNTKSTGGLDKVFPVYALGISKPEPEPVVSVANSADPIWDAVRDEAKLVVCFMISIGLIVRWVFNFYSCISLKTPSLSVLMDQLVL